MDQNRRTFAMQMVGVAAAAAAGIGTVEAAEHQYGTKISAPAADGWKPATDTKSRCGICQFWGGMRKVSEDKKQVVAVSLGWCNNPASPNCQQMTPAVHEMTKSGVWTKWGALFPDGWLMRGSAAGEMIALSQRNRVGIPCPHGLLIFP